MYGFTNSRKLLVNDCKWVEGISEFDKIFIKSYKKENDEEYFLEVGIQYQKKLDNYTTIYCLCLKK